MAADLGYADPDRLVALSDFELHLRELAQHFFDDDQEVMRSGEPKLDIEEFMVDTSGRKKWLPTSRVPLRNDDGEIIGLVGIAISPPAGSPKRRCTSSPITTP